MGFSSQWNFGRKMHKWPAFVMQSSNIEIWFAKSSWWLSKRAMQQPVFSYGQTGLHLALILSTLKPHSLSVCSKPFASPPSVIIFWMCPPRALTGLFIGIMVSLWMCCFPPFPLFISQACSVSGARDAWAEDWSNTKTAWQCGWAASKVGIASLHTCAINWLVSHQASPLEPR